MRLSPEAAADPLTIQRELSRKLGQSVAEDRFIVLHRSIDARRKPIRVNLTLAVYDDRELAPPRIHPVVYQNCAAAPPVIIVGAGPAGLFAALRLLETGLKPIVVERGKPVQERRRDVAALNRRGILNEASNYAFGEGGAGTFSDGKLYTRSKKRGDYHRILNQFCQHGADPSILSETHPHIGSNRLPGIIQAIRETLVSHGGELHFESKVTGLCRSGDHISGVILENGVSLTGKAVILATGHSARDVYAMLAGQGLRLEAKAFAMGVRVEHPQALIDRIQYHGEPRGPFLPAAAYVLTHQAEGRGVYSFCMCPGGVIVPASTEPDGLVVNGMSFSRRNTAFANAGIVVEIRLEDIPDLERHGPLAGLVFQRHLEQLAFQHSTGTMRAPAQRLTDFVEGKPSASLPACSYPPGVDPSPLSDWLPPFMVHRLQAAFSAFNQKMKGFLTSEAVVVGVESRTSSPVRIPRNPETLEHVDVNGLFPCGEGAGYAGGIVSCAMDGQRVADAVCKMNGHEKHAC